jgi:signal transduction histidine kinase
MSKTTKKIKIRFVYKLLIGFGSLCIIIGIISIFGNKTINDSELLHTVINKQIQALTKINQLHYRANQIRLIEVELFENSDYYTVTGEIDNLSNLAELLEKDLRNIISTAVLKENKRISTLLNNWQLYRRGLEQSLQYAKSMDMSKAKETSRYSSFPSFRVFSKNLDLISSDIEEKAQQSYDVSIAALKMKRYTFLSASIIGILGSIAATFVLSRSLSKRVSALRMGALNLANGDMDKPILIEGNDELSDLAVSFNEMADNLQKTTTSIDNLNREIAERKKAEEKQAELLGKLEDVNQELKDFAYIISHDLKAPLRGIKSIIGFLAADYAEKFDEEGQKQLELLVSRVGRMQALIEGVLNYSRVGRVEKEETAVDLNSLLPEIIDLIAPPENISIMIDNEMPVIMCERTCISQVFQNLLSNAVKYMDKPDGIIKVGCVKENDFWRFSVADNGPGIEERHFEQIFKVFQTLKRRDEVEGTGIGLSIVKKIIGTYSGNIWVESEVGRGSTFFFTLPLNLQAPEAAMAEMEAKA